MSKQVVYKTKLIFKIKDFMNSDENEITSDVFTIGTDKWYVSVEPKSLRDDMEYMSVYLTLDESTEPTVTADLIVYPLSRSYRRLSQLVLDRNEFTAEDSSWGSELMRREDLLKHKNILLLNDVLTVGFDINVYKTTNDCNEMKSIFDNSFNVKHLSDCHLIVGQKEFYVSKAVLSSRSDVFQSMFATDMKEKNMNEVVIEDIVEEVFEEFLKFIYFQRTDRLEELAEQLLYVSDRYQVLDLKNICQNLIEFNLNPKNAIKALIQFNAINSTDFVNKTIEFCAKNYKRIRRQSEKEWLELIRSDDQTMRQLSDGVLDKMSQLITDSDLSVVQSRKRKHSSIEANTVIKTYTYRLFL